jgi:FkbM family methyltransferase
MIRSFIERMSRQIVFRRRLPAKFQSAPIYVSPSGGLRYLLKSMQEVDPLLLKFCELYIKQGMTVWDVGANVGLFTVSASALAGASGRVYSFEPDSWLVQLLRKTAVIQSSTASKIEVLPVGVANACQFRRFGLATRSRSTNFLEGYGSTQTGGVREWITIMCISLDWALENVSPPDILKIDVEGAEVEVLEGASMLFSKHRPVLHIEVNKETWSRVLEILTPHGYAFYDADMLQDGLRPVSQNISNLLAIPST